MSVQDLLNIATKFESATLQKSANDAAHWAKLIGNYDSSVLMLEDLLEGFKLSHATFWHESAKDEEAKNILTILNQQAEAFAKIRPELEALDALFPF